MGRCLDRRRTGRCLPTVAALALAAAVASGCGASALGHTEQSPEDLARAVLQAVEHRDPARLRELAIDEAEFRHVVWPELPAARPERNLSAEFVWNGLRHKSEATLRRMMEEHGGHAYGFVGVRFTGGTTQYGSYLVHRAAAVEVRGADGSMQTLRLFGSVLERYGSFKVFSYVVD